MIGVAVSAALGEGDGFEGVGQGFERAGDPRGWWPTPGGGEGLGSAWVGAALLAAVGRVIPGRQGCRELLEVKPGGKGSVFGAATLNRYIFNVPTGWYSNCPL